MNLGEDRPSAIEIVAKKGWPNDPLGAAAAKLANVAVGAATGNPLAGLAAESLIDALRSKAADLVEHREQTFFSALGSGKKRLTDDGVKDDHFVQAFLATLSAVRRTDREEKIRMFARLLTSFYPYAPQENLDAHEEYLRILDDLSMREIEVLVMLSKKEDAARKPVEAGAVSYRPYRADTPSKPLPYWEDFNRDATTRLRVGKMELYGIIERLTRTGFIRTITTSNYGQTDQQAILTPNFYVFAELVDLPVDTTGQ